MACANSGFRQNIRQYKEEARTDWVYWTQPVRGRLSGFRTVRRTRVPPFGGEAFRKRRSMLE